MNNEKLAFNITLDGLGNYATKCKKDPITKTMNPIEGSYLMSNSLAVALLYKAEGHIEECKDILHEAINDAYHQITGANNDR